MPASELFPKVYQYLEGKIGLEQLEDWLVPRLPVFFQQPASTVTDFVATIELGLAEMSAGHRTEQEFRQLLTDFIQRQERFVRFIEEKPTEVTGASYTIDQPTVTLGPGYLLTSSYI